MSEDNKFELLKDLQEQALKREEERKDSFERRAANIVGFLGATIGIFIGTLLPQLLSDKYLKDTTSCKTFFFWILSMVCLAGGIILFLILVWIWRKMLRPGIYMYPNAFLLRVTDDISVIQNGYLTDLNKSVENNQDTVNALGTKYIWMVNLVIFIVVLYFLSVLFFAISKLIS